MRILPWLFLAAFIFCLTYSPQKIPQTNSLQARAGQSCCSNDKHMAENPVQCRNAHYRGVQFGNPDYGCPKRHPQVYQGAIIGV